MKIRDLLKEKEITLSFEVFPPKTADKYEAVAQATEGIASLKPDFMSVTYGAGGGTSAHTVSLAADLKQNYGVETMCHLTCVASGKAQVRSQLEKMKEAGLENVLALRGDIPEEGSFPDAGHYHYASELIAEIREFGDFSIGGACYPEGHVESANKKEDLLHLKEKVDAGCDFLTTQMFFDNDILYNFLCRVREIGVTVPVLPGIMPVTNAKQMKRICSLSGTYLPARFKAIVDRFGDDPAAMKQAGIAYATEQIIDLLANNVNHIHVYSMNKPEVAGQILANLSAILGR